MRRSVRTDGAPRPVGPYSQGVLAGDLLFVSGQLGLDPSTSELVPGGIGAEAGRCMENIKAVLAQAGLAMGDVIKTSIYLTDLASFKEVNRVYASYFAYDPPARTTVGVATLPMGARVEIEAVALRPQA